MGCCFSSNNKSPHQPDAPKPPPLPESNNSRAPPPVFEEETVKEVVLSETPLPKPQIPKENRTQMPVIEEDLVEAKDYVNKHDEEEEEVVSQVSQVSEMYSISESFSTTTTTTTITDKRDDEAISKPTIREVSHRTPAKVPRKRPYTGEISRGAKSPAKRPETSHHGPRRTMPRNVGSNGVRRETGEGPSSRRSRSPATRTVGGVGRSPGKVTARRPGGLSRVENTGQKEIDLNDGVLQQEKKSEFINESIDNPHVSLECFIFL
ncbi:hypothetical protein Dsin_031497 [Dipteronia sinensis]|uniref:Uncharacterized protein n=1 Tax=Dipteronia sinensis TaxID=43782 RepID=A0AAD9ZLH3_9ROSI|nr:hypothetical protein Dsin_031497 [Dipteronia sinensis]